MIEFLAAVLTLFVVGVLALIVYWMFAGPKPEPPGSRQPYRPITDDDEDATDPNWEDHIRHDPYHPGGSAGGGYSGFHGGDYDDHDEH